MVLTRKATAEDEARAIELLAQLFEDPREANVTSGSFLRMLDSERGTVIVAEEDGAVLGLISMSFNLAIRYEVGYAQIEEVVVDAAARGKQAGAILVRAAIDEATRRGCNEIGLYPRETTRAFYEKLGFAYVGVELRQPLNR